MAGQRGQVEEGQVDEREGSADSKTTLDETRFLIFVGRDGEKG